MTLSEAFVLALIQGVTEFLPISSSAHLILAPYLLGWQPHGLRFDVVTNAGTLLAAVVYFRRDLFRAWRRVRQGPPNLPGGGPGLGPAVLVASFPVLATAALGYGWFATAARRPELIAFTTVVFALFLAWADRAGSRTRDLAELTWRDSLTIGAAQAFALIPGTSRSGVTMTVGLALGFTREGAARFSFLLAIPVGIAAVGRDLFDLLSTGQPLADGGPLAVGFVVSAISAYLVIGWLLAWLQRQTLTLFVVYRLALGLVILAL